MDTFILLNLANESSLGHLFEQNTKQFESPTVHATENISLAE